LKIAEGETFRWKGYYEYDLNTAHTVATELNVFRDFAPVLPEEYRDSPYVFLGNIDPLLQMDILSQVRKPKLVALDTMNYWIENSPGPLRDVIGMADIVIFNDGEIREISGEYNLVKAARTVMGWGPGRVVIKRGEYGVLHLSNGTMFATSTAERSAEGLPGVEVARPNSCATLVSSVARESRPRHSRIACPTTSG